MMVTKETVFTKDVANKKMTVVREFDAPVDIVWQAWTQSDLLDQWWAPRPWKANTKSMDFRNGGQWLYYMEGPDGSRHYCKAEYKNVVPNQSFVGVDTFTDENGNIIAEMPRMTWNCVFAAAGKGTKVTVNLTFDKVEDLEKIVEMGFKEGFAAAHNNLDELLAGMAH